MRDKNKIMKAQLVSGTGLLKQTCLNSDYVVTSVLVFGDVAATTEIVQLYSVSLNL